MTLSKCLLIWVLGLYDSAKFFPLFVKGSIHAAANRKCQKMFEKMRVHLKKIQAGHNKRLMSELRSVASFLWRKYAIKKKPLHFVTIGERYATTSGEIVERTTYE